MNPSPNLVEPIITIEKLAEKCERLVQTDHITYVEAVIHVADELDVEPEDIGKIIKGPLKDKIEAEAQRANILPRSKTASLFEV